MAELNIGKSAPNFTLPTDSGGEVTLSEFKGQKVILYFYPKDDTPGCTAESCEFRDNLPAFENMNAQVIGISKCSVKKHDKFKAKYDLNFPLASDENTDVCETYGVWTEKSMYGKTYMGMVRTTYLVDRDGTIARVWDKVKVKGHAEEVLQAAKAL